VGGGTAPRLCTLCSQYRTAARRGLATSVPRCHDRYDEDLKKTILEIEVRGKRGVGYCKSMPGAVLPFKRLRSRLRPAPTGTSETCAIPSGQWRTPEPTNLIFPKWQRELFKTILDEERLRIDRKGQPRTAYSLRHTYICLRLMEGADIYQIAKNCRTSVEMIEKYYASHIKTSLDAVAINVMRPKKRKSKEARLTDVA